MQSSLLKIIQNFPKTKIGLIGDLMLDQWIIGSVERVSPEAPIPVVLWEKNMETGGGASNTAINITNMDGEVCLFGLIGKDSAGKKLCKILKEKKIDTDLILKENTKPTIQKIRVVGRRGPEQQIVRIDKEDTTEADGRTVEKFLKNLQNTIKNLDIIIFSDYDKGFITKKLAQETISMAKKEKKYVIVDTKPSKIDYFQACSLITPNIEEASEMSKIKINNTNNQTVEKAGKILQKKLSCDCIITRSEKGMSIFEKNKITHIPTEAQEIYDVSGAGDTVVAVLGLAIASGASLEQAACLANKAAGIVVAKAGTASVTKKELQKLLN